MTCTTPKRTGEVSTCRLDRDGVQALFATFPNVVEPDPEARAAHLDALAGAVDAEGGVIDDPFVTAIYAVRSVA